MKPGAFDVVEQTHLMDETLQTLQKHATQRDPAGRRAVHYPAAVRRLSLARGAPRDPAEGDCMANLDMIA